MVPGAFAFEPGETVGILLPSIVPLSDKGLGFDVPEMWATIVGDVEDDVIVNLAVLGDVDVEVSVLRSVSDGQSTIRELILRKV